MQKNIHRKLVVETVVENSPMAQPLRHRASEFKEAGKSASSASVNLKTQDGEKQPKGTSSARLAHNLKETAELLGGISVKSVRRLCKRGLLQYSTGLRKLLVPRSAIEKYLRETAVGGDQ